MDVYPSMAYSALDAANDAEIFVQLHYDSDSLGLCGYELNKLNNEDSLLKSRQCQTLHDELKRFGEIIRVFEHCVDSSSSSCKNSNSFSRSTNSYSSCKSKNSRLGSDYFIDKNYSLPLEWHLEDDLDKQSKDDTVWYIKRSSDVYSQVYSSAAQLAEVTSKRNKNLKQLKSDFERDSIFINGKLFQRSKVTDTYSSILSYLENKCYQIRKDCNYSLEILPSKFKLFSTYCLLLASTSEIGVEILKNCLEPLLVPSDKLMLPDRTRPTKLRLYSKYEVSSDNRKHPNPARCMIFCDIEAEMAFEINPRIESDDFPDFSIDEVDGIGKSGQALRLRAQCFRSVYVYLDSMEYFYSNSKLLLTPLN